MNCFSDNRLKVNDGFGADFSKDNNHARFGRCFDAYFGIRVL